MSLGKRYTDEEFKRKVCRMVRAEKKKNKPFLTALYHVEIALGLAFMGPSETTVRKWMKEF